MQMNSKSFFLGGFIYLVFMVHPVTTPAGHAQDWPQWLGEDRLGVWREKGILEKFPVNGPKKLWSVPVGGGYSGPAVKDGFVYLSDRVLNPEVKDPANPFQRTNSKGEERVTCFKADSGELVWRYSYASEYSISYPCGPRATPLVHSGLVYVLGAMGKLVALDASTGKEVWSTDFVKDLGAPVPVWGFSAHPLVFGKSLITLVGGKEKNSLVVAFDLKTGKILWQNLQLESPQNEIGYCPPTLFEVGGKQQLIIWHPEAVCGLEPSTGTLIWSVPFKLKANLSVPNPRMMGNKLLVSSFYNGSMLIDLGPGGNKPTVVWKGNGRGERPGQTDGLHSIMPAPWVTNGLIFGVCSYGELRCLDLDSGKRIWEDLRATGSAKEPIERWANAFLVPHEDRFFIFNEKGDLIIAHLDRNGYREIDRAHVIEPTGSAPGGGPARKVVWSHPAFALKSMFVRNDRELVRISLDK